MNYRKAYCAIINHAKSEEKLGIRSKNNGTYYEAHHILPKSLFPLWKNKESNIVLLTAREHFICHLFLTKIYPDPGMFLAAHLMSSSNGKAYSKLKEGIYTEEFRKKLSDSHKGQIPWNKGIPMSEEDRLKSSDSHKGQIPWNKGKHFSEESKRKMSEAHKGKELTEAQKAHLRKLHKSLTGKPRSEETKEKLRKANKGQVPWNKGKKLDLKKNG